MLEELVKNKVYYKIFDKKRTELSLNYNIHTFKDQSKIDQAKSDIDKIITGFAASRLMLLNQTHGTNIICSSDEWDKDFAVLPEGDASITNEKGLVLAIRTADCVPVLLASENGKVIGAAHCGWRSAKLNIIDKLVSKMRTQSGNSNILCIIGPSIQQQSYEVSKDFYNDFLSESPSYMEFFIPSAKQGHHMFDLPAFVTQKLEKTGVKIVRHIDDDTYTMKDQYPSYRRSAHTGEPYNQNILSAIVIK